MKNVQFSRLPRPPRTLKYLKPSLFTLVIPFCIILPKISTYIKIHQHEIKLMYVLTVEEELLKIYKNIWNKISKSMKKNISIKLRDKTRV